MEISKVDENGEPVAQELSAKDIAEIQKQLFRIGSMAKLKTSGGNKKKPTPEQRKKKRQNQKASRKTNRPKK